MKKFTFWLFIVSIWYFISVTFYSTHLRSQGNGIGWSAINKRAQDNNKAADSLMILANIKWLKADRVDNLLPFILRTSAWYNWGKK